MNPEQGLVLHGVEGTVETLIVLILQCGRGLSPKRFYIIYNIILIGINLLAIFPFRLFAKSDGNGKELTVFVEQALDGGFLQEFLAIIVNIEDNV